MPSSDAVSSDLQSCINLLREDYRDLQDPECDVRGSPPGAVDALRMISKAHPALIHGVKAIADEHLRDWDDPTTYCDILGDGAVTIAVTDDGLADSVRSMPDGSMAFCKPLEEQLDFRTFVDRLRDPSESEVLYLQSQDGNIFRSEPHPSGCPELGAFAPFVKRDLAWMRDAVGEKAEAVNLWIGSSRSVTSIHHDPYENIYHVLSGVKTFTLISPIEGLWLDQRFYPPSTLHRTPSGLVPIPDPPPAYPIPWVASASVPNGVKALQIEVKAGESLYLPAEWWHRVEQSPGPKGLCVAVNYWYPATIDAGRYAHDRFARRIARQAGFTGVIPPPGDDGSDEDPSGQ